jgi:hypothetical protein
VGDNRQTDRPTVEPARAVARAARDALAAPSIFNTQPWRWRVSASGAQLRADRQRQLGAVDPEGRLLALSCGAALHHARTSLASAGLACEVSYLPEPDDADLLATIRLGAETTPTHAAAWRRNAMAVRRTDRRPLANTPVPPAALRALTEATRPYGVGAYVCDEREVLMLSACAWHAATIQQDDAAYLTELAGWTRDAAPGQGIPAEVNGSRVARPVRIRDYYPTGPVEDLTRSDQPAIADRHARYIVLSTDGDRPVDWLATGEAMSAVLVEATALGLATTPMCDVIEVPSARVAVADVINDDGLPGMVIRVGVPKNGVLKKRTPRRAPAEMIEAAA